MVAGLALPGCGGEQAGTGPAAGPPEVDVTTVSVVSPSFEIPSGEERFMCMQVPYKAEQDLYVSQSRALQSPGGHHALLFYTQGEVGVSGEPHECTSDDMGNIRLVGVGTAAGSGISLPDGVAMKLPKGAQLWTQSHYVNTTSDTIVVQDTVELDLIDQADVEHVAGSFVQVDLGLSLPPATTTKRTMECSPPVEMNIPWILAHMHEFGAHFTIEVRRGGEWSTLFESSWHEALRDDFPIVSMKDGLTLTPEDRIRATCEWNNTSAAAISFPSEMCATFMPHYPSTDGAMWVCDHLGNTFQL
jgi:hypothetical protein